MYWHYAQVSRKTAVFPHHGEILAENEDYMQWGEPRDGRQSPDPILRHLDAAVRPLLIDDTWIDNFKTFFFKLLNPFLSLVTETALACI